MASTHKIKWALVLAVMFLLSLGWVSATFISMRTEITDIIIEDEIGQSRVTLQNMGDEAAFDVGFSFLLPKGFEGEEVYVGRLEPDEQFKREFTIDTEGNVPDGTYPAILIVTYRDANSYPFSALTPFSVIYKKRTTSGVFGKIDEVVLFGDKKEALTLQIRNPDEVPHDLKIRLYLPRELVAEATTKTITIKPSGEATVEFRVSSFSALPGSQYGVFASAKYEEGGLTYSSISRGSIRVEREKPLFTQRRLTAALIALIILYIVYQLGASKWIKKG